MDNTGRTSKIDYIVNKIAMEFEDVMIYLHETKFRGTNLAELIE